MSPTRWLVSFAAIAVYSVAEAYGLTFISAMMFGICLADMVKNWGRP